MSNRIGHTVPNLRRRSPLSRGARSVVRGDWSVDSSVIVTGASTAVADWDVLQQFFGESTAVGDWSVATLLPETAWTTDLKSRLATAGLTASVSADQLTAMDAFYASMIDEGLIPATPAEGTGAFQCFHPFLGTSSIAAALIAGIGNDATNAGLLDADRDANGSLTGDGSSGLNLDFAPSDINVPFGFFFYSPSNLSVLNHATIGSLDTVSGDVVRWLTRNSNEHWSNTPSGRSIINSVSSANISSANFYLTTDDGTTSYIYLDGNSTAETVTFGANPALEYPTINFAYMKRSADATNEAMNGTKLSCAGVLKRHVTGTEAAAIGNAIIALMSATGFGRDV